MGDTSQMKHPVYVNTDTNFRTFAETALFCEQFIDQGVYQPGDRLTLFDSHLYLYLYLYLYMYLHLYLYLYLYVDLKLYLYLYFYLYLTRGFVSPETGKVFWCIKASLTFTVLKTKVSNKKVLY